MGGVTESLKFFAETSAKRSFPDNSKPQRLATIKDGGQGNRIYSTEAKGIALAAQSGGTAGNGNMLVANPNQSPLLRPNKIETNYPKTQWHSPIMHAKLICFNLSFKNQKKHVFDVYLKFHNIFNLHNKIFFEENNADEIANRIALCGAMRGRYLVQGVKRGGENKQFLEVRHDSKTNCLTTVQKDNNIVYIDIKDHNNKKVRYEVADIDWRKLTPIECERLQTVRDNYTRFGAIEATEINLRKYATSLKNKKIFLSEDKKFIILNISNTQRYKMLGNGWTIDVIAHIFQELGILDLYKKSLLECKATQARNGS